jgi:hypothetical protein
MSGDRCGGAHQGASQFGGLTHEGMGLRLWRFRRNGRHWRAKRDASWGTEERLSYALTARWPTECVARVLTPTPTVDEQHLIQTRIGGVRPVLD